MAEDMNPMLDPFRRARVAGVPIIAISTPDPAPVVTNTHRAVQELQPGSVSVAWDIVRGMQGLNDAGSAWVAQSGEFDPTIGSPYALLTTCVSLPRFGVVYMHMAPRWMAEPSVIQAIWNLRDVFKSSHRTLVLLGKSFDMPAELTDDVVVLDEPLPGDAELQVLVNTLHADSNIASDEHTTARAVEAVRGLSHFAAEQVTAMSFRKKGLDIDRLWQRKRQMIEQTPGLRVSPRGVSGFESIGGVPVVKEFVKQIVNGRNRPNAIVFIDEIEKMLGGSKGDTSGVTQDQLGAILSYMQDHNATGMIFIGPPGAAKSAVAKAAGDAAEVPTIQLDLGAAKGSLVGQSEQQLRNALKIVTAVSNSNSLWIATCNSIADLPPELRRRFTLGTFFFDLPTAEERASIWDIYLDKYEFKTESGSLEMPWNLPEDSGWTGAEIRNCCDIAWRLGCSLNDAARYIVPVSISAADAIKRLREQANGRFLSASYPGVYRINGTALSSQQAQDTSKRQMSLVD